MPQSNQRGIETLGISPERWDTLDCLNRTSVGLKLYLPISQILTNISLNRTSVGLKRDTRQTELEQSCVPQSNQRGIETVLGR